MPYVPEALMCQKQVGYSGTIKTAYDTGNFRKTQLLLHRIIDTNRHRQEPKGSFPATGGREPVNTRGSSLPEDFLFPERHK
jgi:hypothetical protein